MDIDLTGIKPLFDVVVKVTPGSIELTFAAARFTDEIKRNVFLLEKTGLFVYQPYSHSLEIFARNLFDSQQVAEIAEKLSAYLEGKDLKVSKLIPNAGTGSLWKSIQSFIPA